MHIRLLRAGDPEARGPGGGPDLEKTVAVVECPGYGPEEVGRAVERLVDLLGGWGRFVRPGETILVKPNLLSAKKPGEAVTTHPSVIEAAARGVIGAGGRAVLADSPGGPFNQTLLRRVYRETGMDGVADRSGATLNFNTSDAALKVSPGGIIASVTVMEEVARADGVISVSKLKTHSLTRLTGAVKNTFGTIPGLKKAEYHVRMTRVEDFAAMLVDTVRTVNPRLHLMDAVTGMDGEGPSAGSPVDIGVLMASACPFSLDLVAAALVGVRPAEVPTILEAVRRGYIGEALEQIHLLGDPVSMPRVKYRLPPRARDVDLLRAGSRGRLPAWLVRAAGNRLRPSPGFSREICTGCGECSRVCPPGAIKMLDKRPVADLEKCIRCFCCQELCPNKAVLINRPLLGRLLFQ